MTVKNISCMNTGLKIPKPGYLPFYHLQLIQAIIPFRKSDQYHL